MSRHEAGWVPDTQPATPPHQGRHRTEEESQAMAGYRLCVDCRVNHFRAYPEFPEEPCMLDRCQCWCMR